MPVTAIAAGASGLLSAGTGISQAISSGKEVKRYQNLIDNYKRQELRNSMEDVQVSTLGADRQREDLSRSVATMANNAAMGGGRSVVGLASNVLQSQMENEAKIVADLDMQEKQRQQLIAQGAFSVQQMQEQREKDDLLGLGQAMATAQQNKANGWNTFGQGMMSLGMGAASGVFDGIGKGSGIEKGIGKVGEWRTGTAEYDPIAFANNSAGMIPNPTAFNPNPTEFNGIKQYNTPAWMLGLK